jgi:hypothetical protein
MDAGEATLLAGRFVQRDDARRRFDRAILQQEKRRRGAVVERMKQEHPVLGTVLAPLAHLVLLDDDLRDWEKGQSGESGVSRMLKRLPKPWCYLDDVVLERKPDEFMQIDHIAVGPGGVVAIETKNWHGAVQGYKDVWKVKAHGTWQRVDVGPTRQAVWHAHALQAYLTGVGFPMRVAPVVVFVSPDWLRVDRCSCPVFSDVGALRDHLLSLDVGEEASPELYRDVARTISESYELDVTSASGPEGRAPSPKQGP